MNERELQNMSVSQLRKVLSDMGASPRGARTKEQLISRILLELRVRKDLELLRDGAKP